MNLTKKKLICMDMWSDHNERIRLQSLSKSPSIIIESPDFLQRNHVEVGRHEVLQFRLIVEA